MLSDLPGEVVALMVLYLADYRDFRQLLWHCRAGGSILARAQSLDVDGVYTCDVSGGNPFDYRRFHALLQLSVTIRFCLPHCIYDFMQFSGVRELNLHISGIMSPSRLRALMTFVEYDLSEEIHHIGIHLRFAVSSVTQSSAIRRSLIRHFWWRTRIHQEDFAQYILMLENHNTLRSFAVSIAGEPFTVQWACQLLLIPPPGP